MVIDEFLNNNPPGSKLSQLNVRLCRVHKCFDNKYKKIYLHLSPAAIGIENLMVEALESSEDSNTREMFGCAPRGALERGIQDAIDCLDDMD